MDRVSFLAKELNSPYNSFDNFEPHPHHVRQQSYLRQKIHEKNIDEFFLTDTEAPPKRHSNLALIGSIIGVIIPAVLCAKKQLPDKNTKFMEIVKKSVNLEYELKEILSVGLGGAIGGLIGGLTDRKEKDKLNKLEEAFFQLMNITFPAVLVDQSMKLCKKKPFNNSYAKVALTALSIAAGAGSAVAIANVTDNYIFDNYNHDKDRELNHKDLIIHVDDLIGSLVLAKIPFADKLHANKILLAIYAWSGYHVGDH